MFSDISRLSVFGYFPFHYTNTSIAVFCTSFSGIIKFDLCYYEYKHIFNTYYIWPEGFIDVVYIIILGIDIIVTKYQIL